MGGPATNGGTVNVANAIVEKALRQGREALREREAKDLLAAYGVTVVEGEEVHDAKAAVAAAERLGHPVVMKGSSSRILHKSEAGLVLIGVADAGAVREGFEKLSQRAGGDLEAVLVERMAGGSREFVAGLTRDPQFGPVVMFGVGGVLTEALDDVVFGVAPLSEREAREMLGGIRSRPLLGPFRGEPAVDRRALAGLLGALGEIGRAHPHIREIDCNPVMVEGGSPVVVDALISLAEPLPPPKAPRAPADRLSAVFSPRSVAVIGASNTVTKWGGSIMANILGGGYPGVVYPVNPSSPEIFGIRSYPTVADLPEAPDLALIAVPAAAVRETVEQCGEKGVKAAVVITSGFSEASEEGAREEEAIAETATAYGMALVGPNCMGLVSAWSRFYAVGAAIMRPAAGPASFISQSGNMGIQLMASAEQRRGGIGKFVGIGNQAQMGTTDFMRFFLDDPETGVIVAYVEGIKDGRRFLETAREAAPRKPVAVLRGGTSRYGSRAAASHTGAMAGSARVFEAAARQAGVMVTHDPDEFMDLTFALSHLPLPRGRRVAIVTMGGGWGVVSADEAARSDLELAALPAEVIGELDEILPPFWNRGNPVDLVGTTAEGVAERAVEAVITCDAVDMVVVLGVIGMMTTPIRIFEETDRLKAARNFDLGYEQRPDPQSFCRREASFMRRVSELMEQCDKPVINISFTPIEQAVFSYGGRYATLVLPSPLRGVRVAGRLGRYAEYLKRSREDGA